MKRLFSLLLCVLMVAGMGISVIAETTPQVIAEGDCSYTASDHVSWKVTDDGILTIYGTGKMKNYSHEQDNIPPYFEYKDLFHTLVIEEGVTSIGYEAFYMLDNLTGTLDIPDSVSSIGPSAFYKCTGFIGDIVLPDGLTSLGIEAFSNCTGFNGTLYLGKSLRKITHHSFLNCKNLHGSIIIPDTVTQIDSECFSNDAGFTGDLIIPENVTQVGISAFSWCTGLDGNLILNNKLQRIDMYAFMYCSGLKGDIVVPDSVTYLGTGAFYQDSSFDGGITIGSGVRTINASAFFGCTGLTVPLSIPETVTNVGTCAFHACGLDNDIKAFFINHPDYLKTNTTGSREATCTQPGIRRETVRCKTCDQLLISYNEEIPARGHRLVYVPAVEATSEQNGNVEHYRCSDCGALFFDANGTQPATEEALTLPRLPSVVKAEAILLNTEKIELLPSQIFQLQATVLPEDAADKTVNWYTEPNDVISVDWNTGLVTALQPGSTFVACFSADGPLVTVPVIVHNPGAPIYENITVQPTCVDSGLCDIVVYCEDCGKELSREQGPIPVNGAHTADCGNRENFTAPDCTHDGSYDYVIRCSICGEILSSEHYTTDPLGHTPGVEQRTDEVAATCTEKGSYIETILCETCGEIISTKTYETPALGHTTGETVKQDIIEPTCTDNGSFTEITRCAVCGEIISDFEVITQASGHIPSDAIISNVIAPTCSQEGSHVETVICAACGEVISSETVCDGYGAHEWNQGEVQSGEYDRYTLTDYTCIVCGKQKTERTLNPNCQFRCKRCDWYDANKDTKGIFGIVVWMIHTITHLVQQINYWT